MEESIELYFREGSSDKIYRTALKSNAHISGKDEYHVNFAYGRRGNSLVTGSKTSTALPYAEAKKIYDKLVREKTGKGYKVLGSGGVVINTSEARDTGVRPQLLNEIEEELLEKYINDPNYCAQEKFDGRRRLLVKTGTKATGANRKGLAVPISSEMEKEVLAVHAGDVSLDGEAFDNYVMVFDYVDPTLSYADRYDNLRDMFSKKMDTMQLIPTAWNAKEKRNLLDRLKAENAEGIVFKDITAKYTPGRPNSGGTQLKFKFCATASCVVGKINEGKRSVALVVYDGKKEIEVGNVTVYPNQDIPKPGTVVEVKYLYYFAGGSLFQPVLLGEREDLDADECTLSQLKLKKETVE